MSVVKGGNYIPPTMSNIPVIQKVPYIHISKIPNRPAIKSPGL